MPPPRNESVRKAHLPNLHRASHSHRRSDSIRAFGEVIRRLWQQLPEELRKPVAARGFSRLKPRAARAGSSVAQGLSVRRPWMAAKNSVTLAGKPQISLKNADASSIGVPLAPVCNTLNCMALWGQCERELNWRILSIWHCADDTYDHWGL
jgi:hypothetical protein